MKVSALSKSFLNVLFVCLVAIEPVPSPTTEESNLGIFEHVGLTKATKVFC